MSELTNAELKKELEKMFDKIEIHIIPDKKDPFNLDKAMVWFFTEPGPYDGLFIKREEIENLKS
jgi:hypothetical protein